MFAITDLKKLMVAICLEMKRPQPEAALEDHDAWSGCGGDKGGVGGFEMPVHYPRFTSAQYAAMEEWRLDNLLSQYGLQATGSMEEKREAAMGHFLWPEQQRTEADARRPRDGNGEKGNVGDGPDGFQMPVHYPRFTRAQYAAMEEWRIDNLLSQYGLQATGRMEEKREAAMGHFLWPEEQRTEADARRPRDGNGEKGNVGDGPDGFQMPVHYPRFTRAQYAAMEEWRLDNLLKRYGVPCGASLEEKRETAMGHFLWS